MHFEIYRDVKGEWRWTLYASNGRKIADSGEGYHKRADCEHGISLVQASGGAIIREGRPVTIPFGFGPPGQKM